MTRTILLAVAAMPLLAGTAGAVQQWPASIVGNWNALSNQSSLTVSITSQGGGATCQQIAGTIGGEALLGYYCPGSGRFNFLRTNANGTTYQAYTGNLTDTAMGAPAMAGVFVDYYDNPTGEFNFLANPAQ